MINKRRGKEFILCDVLRLYNITNFCPTVFYLQQSETLRYAKLSRIYLESSSRIFHWSKLSNVFIAVFWTVTLCSLVADYHCFGGTFFIHLHFYPEDGGSM
jgi:hypothetical protein